MEINLAMNNQATKKKSSVEDKYNKVFNGYAPKFLMIDIKSTGKIKKNVR